MLNYSCYDCVHVRLETKEFFRAMSRHCNCILKLGSLLSLSWVLIKGTCRALYGQCCLDNTGHVEHASGRYLDIFCIICSK